MRLLSTLTAAALAAALLAAPAFADDGRPGRARGGADRRGPPGAARFGPQQAERMQKIRRARMLRQRARMMRLHRDRMQPGRRGPQQARAASPFDRLDRNHDGVLDRREFAAALAHLRAQGPQGRHARKGRALRGQGLRGQGLREQGPRGGAMRGRMMRGQAMGARGMHPKAQRGQGFGPDRAPPRARAGKKPDRAGQGPADAERRRRKAIAAAVLHRLKLADTNRDGKLDRKETPQVLRKHFAKLDRDEDGFLGPKELKGAVRVLAKSRRAGAGAEKSAGKKPRKRAPGGKKRRD